MLKYVGNFSELAVSGAVISSIVAVALPLPSMAVLVIAAGIPFEDKAGRIFDVHAFRHQTGSLLAAAGVTPKVAQQLMRHSDIKLTMDIYTHVMTGQERAAVDSLPNLTKKKYQETGTE